VYHEVNLLKGETREPWFLEKNHRAAEGGFPMDGLSGLQRWFERIEARPRYISIDTLPA
jgi:hypothetical protein